MKMSDSFDADSGQLVEYMGRPKLTHDDVVKARDLSIAKMRRAGYTFAAIGRFHGVDRAYIKRRYDALPEHIKGRVAEVLESSRANVV